TGDFNGDFYEEIAVGWERTDNNLFTDIFLQVAQVSTGLGSVQMIDFPERVTGSNGQNGWPLSVATGDVNLNGHDEILFTARNDMRVYKTDVVLAVQSSPLAFFSISTDESHTFHQVAAITDLDLTESDTIRTDFVVADRNNIHVFQGTPDGEGLKFDFNPVATVRDFGMVLVTGDFDGDAVRLGPPARETRTNIVQPLVILNAPPIHFDVFNSQAFDVNKCYNGNTCEHRAIYENAQSIEMEVSTQVNADWGVSKSLSVSAGASYGPVSASVTGTLSRRYGEGFSNVSGESQAYKVTVTSDAIEDDRVYATVSNYEILEYPVYADNELKGHVVAVVPIQQGVNSLKNTWFSAKSGNARAYLSAHEVGNIFSYQKTATLPPGATLFGRGGLAGGGGDTWELSPNSTQKWEIRFSSEQITERERTSFQQVSRSLSGEVSADFSFFSASISASVSDDYETSQISTHRTTVQKESAISVEFGTIDAGILGTKTYTVSPYVYWAENGALVLDYAVNPDISAGVPSWWEQNYGDKPDLAFTLPWRNDEAKGIGSTNPEVQREESREIIFNPANPLPGESVEIITRVHNFSLVDYFATSSVKFYLGDPRAGGTLIASESGQSVVDVPALRTRDSQVASLKDWRVPEGMTKDTKIYAVIDAENAVEEVHENNNIAWNLVNPFISPTTSVDDDFGQIPADFDLAQNYPNPFNPTTVIHFNVPEAVEVKLTVYNLLGEVVAELLDGEMQVGAHEIVFDASRLATGVYFYRLQAGQGFVSVKKMLLTK
ncbi:MAG: T9SS type A sorting domain-containing protein, partial [bacterium]